MEDSQVAVQYDIVKTVKLTLLLQSSTLRHSVEL
jgi:hypothetical protein